MRISKSANKEQMNYIERVALRVAKSSPKSFIIISNSTLATKTLGILWMDGIKWKHALYLCWETECLEELDKKWCLEDCHLSSSRLLSSPHRTQVLPRGVEAECQEHWAPSINSRTITKLFWCCLHGHCLIQITCVLSMSTPYYF